MRAKSEGKLVLFIVGGKTGIGHELGGCSLPSAPDLGRRKLHSVVRAGQAAVIGREQIIALSLRDVSKVRLPGIGKEDGSAALVKPVNLLLANQEDAAQDDFRHAMRMSLAIGKSQRGAPRPAEDLPAINAEVLADFFNVGDQVPGGVGFQRRIRRALAASALVKIHDAVFFRMEEAALLGIRAAAGTSVKKNYRLAGGMATFLKVDFVERRDAEFARSVW